MGLSEEEHAGGVCSSYDLSEKFDPQAILQTHTHTFNDTLKHGISNERA